MLNDIKLNVVIPSVEAPERLSLTSLSLASQTFVGKAKKSPQNANANGKWAKFLTLS